MRKPRSLAAVILALAAFATWGAASARARTVKIGVILTYSGPNAEPSVALDKAITLYTKLHKKDLPPGVKLQIIRRDDTGINPVVAKRLAQELVTRDHVQMLAGVIWSPNAVAVGQVATAAKVPFIIMNAASSSITRTSPYIVRTSWTVWQNAYPLGKWAAQQGWHTAYTIVTDYAPGYDGEAAFIKAFKDGGGKIVGSVRVPLSDSDFVPFLQRVKDAKPDVVFNFNPGGRQALEFMNAWTTLGLKKSGIHLVATDDLVTDDELPNMGDAPLGVITSGPYSTAATRPQNKAFLAEWKKAYGAKSIPNYGGVAAWDGMAAIFSVIEKTKGKFTTDQAMAILSHWKNPNSPRGPISIDPKTRDIVQNIYIRRTEMVNGKLANVEFATIPQIKDPWKELHPR